MGNAGFTASLAGARIEAEPRWRAFPRTGEAARRAQALSLKAGETGVWDGRFEILAARALEVRCFSGRRCPSARTAWR